VETGESTHISFLSKLRECPTRSGWHAFDQRYRELLYRYALRRGAAHAEAEDIVQEVEMNVFKSMNEFRYDRTKGRFRAYLRTSVVHAMARRSAKNRNEHALDPEVLASTMDADSDSDPIWEREWQLHRLRCAMDEIACEFEPVTMMAFQLHVMSGCSVEDTASHLGLSRASVYQAKCRVLKRLREKIDQADSEVP
jgi:RNA polymerase sigma-70 factor (ECF subfamily)